MGELTCRFPAGPQFQAREWEMVVGLQAVLGSYQAFPYFPQGSEKKGWPTGAQSIHVTALFSRFGECSNWMARA